MDERKLTGDIRSDGFVVSLKIIWNLTSLEWGLIRQVHCSIEHHLISNIVCVRSDQTDSLFHRATIVKLLLAFALVWLKTMKWSEIHFQLWMTAPESFLKLETNCFSDWIEFELLLFLMINYCTPFVFKNKYLYHCVGHVLFRWSRFVLQWWVALRDQWCVLDLSG